MSARESENMITLRSLILSQLKLGGLFEIFL